MNQEVMDFITFAKVLVPAVIAFIGGGKYLIRSHFKALKEAQEREFKLKAELANVEKENNQKAMDQVNEGIRFLKIAQVEVAKRLEETTLMAQGYRKDLERVQEVFTLKIETATKRIETLENKIHSVVTDLGEGKVRVSGPKF